MDSDEMFMEELKNEFLEKTSANLKKMLEFFKNDNFLEIRKIAHDIKGTAGIFDMEKGSDIGKSLQAAADAENRDVVKQLIDEMVLYMRDQGVEI